MRTGKSFFTASQNDGLDTRVLFQLGHDLVKFHEQASTERVQGLWPVQLDHANILLGLGRNEVFVLAERRLLGSV